MGVKSLFIHYFKKHLDQMLVKFEQDWLARTTQDFKLFDRKQQQQQQQQQQIPDF